MAQDSERRPTARPRSRTIHWVPGGSQAPASAANNPMNGRCWVTFPRDPHTRALPTSRQVQLSPSIPRAPTLAAFLAPGHTEPLLTSGSWQPLIPLPGTLYSFPRLSSLCSCSSCLLSPRGWSLPGFPSSHLECLIILSICFLLSVSYF